MKTGIGDVATAGVSYVSLTSLPNVFMSAGIGDQIITQGLAIGLSFVFTVVSKLITRLISNRVNRKKELTKEEVLEETKAELRNYWNEKGVQITDEKIDVAAKELAQKVLKKIKQK